MTARIKSRSRRICFRVLLFGIAIPFLAALATLLGDGLVDEIAPADVGIVFGNTVHPDGTPSRRLAARLDRAHELYRAEIIPLVIVSGGLGREGHDEAVVMADYLVKKGIPSNKLIIDSAGITTLASAKAARTILQQQHLKSAMVITQYFHVPRAKLALRRCGITPVYGAHARIAELRDLYAIPRELVAYVRYAFQQSHEYGASQFLAPRCSSRGAGSFGDSGAYSESRAGAK